MNYARAYRHPVFCDLYMVPPWLLVRNKFAAVVVLVTNALAAYGIYWDNLLIVVSMLALESALYYFDQRMMHYRYHAESLSDAIFNFIGMLVIAGIALAIAH